MAFSALQERQQDAVFATLGRDATWEGILDPVRIILRESEQIVGMAVDDRVTVRVRRSEVEEPAEGQKIFVTDFKTLQIFGRPRLNRNGTWLCEAEPV